jgi:exodeoxyribonuclease VII large subunit
LRLIESSAVSQPAFDFDDIVPDEFADPTFTVGELAEAINEQLQRGFRGGIWVRGEISDLSNRGAHTYFSLIEAGDKGKAAQVPPRTPQWDERPDQRRP